MIKVLVRYASKSDYEVMEFKDLEDCVKTLLEKNRLANGIIIDYPSWYASDEHHVDWDALVYDDYIE